MGSWKNHVRARLQQRDFSEKLPFVGVFTSLSQLEERFEIRTQILDDVSKSSERDGVEAGENIRLLQLQHRESEHLAEKLSQTVSELTTVLYLKEAELQYRQSRLSYYRQEALTLAKGSNTLKATLSELEFTIECQSKQLAALCAEQRGRKEALEQAGREKEELLQRWMEQKREEADRMNKYNDMQERWQRLAEHLRKHRHRETGKGSVPIVTSSGNVTTEKSPSVIQFDSTDSAEMVKGGKRHSSMSNDGKWFAHSLVPESETRNRETCTSTGIMLTQVKSSLPQTLDFEHYPKWKTQQWTVLPVRVSLQESREFPSSDHDNKHALKDNISVFSHGVGRRKCFENRRQHISHFCLCHDGADSSAEETRGNITVYQTDFKEKQAARNGPTSSRRFPRNHQQKSAGAALAQAGEQFMWFGRHDSDLSETLQVLAATNYSAPSKH